MEKIRSLKWKTGRQKYRKAKKRIEKIGKLEDQNTPFRRQKINLRSRKQKKKIRAKCANLEENEDRIKLENIVKSFR